MRLFPAWSKRGRAGPRLHGQPKCPDGERDRVVPAAQQQQVQHPVLADRAGQAVPPLVGEVTAGMQLIHGAQHGAVGWVIPAQVLRLAAAEGAELRPGQPGLAGED